MRVLLKLILSLSCICFAKATLYAIDYGNQTISTNQYIRMYNYGYRLAFLDSGRPDASKQFEFNPLVCDNINNAYNHAPVEIFMTPAYKKEAGDITAEVETIFKKFTNTNCNVTVKTLWIRITNGTDSGWTSQTTDNRNFLQTLILAITNPKTPTVVPAAVTVGIYISQQDSNFIFGNDYDFTHATDAAKTALASGLWYINSPSLANFADFTSFGGFKQANVKQYEQHLQFDFNKGRYANRNIWIQKATVTPLTQATAGGNII